MSIIRTRKNKECPFVQIDRRSIEDTRLSFRARGLHAYLMSKTDGWEVHLKHLATQSNKEGLAAVTKAMRELLTLGYAVRAKIKDKAGRFHGWATDVYEYPEQPSPNIDFLISEKPRSEKPRSEDHGYSLYSKENLDLNRHNIGLYSPIVPQKNKEGFTKPEESASDSSSSQEGFAAEEGMAYKEGKVTRNGAGRLDAASRPGENIVNKGRDILGEAEGDNNQPLETLPNPQNTHTSRDKAPELDKETLPLQRGIQKTKKRDIKQEAQEILEYLNLKSESQLTNAGFIPARLKEGRTVEECKLVIDWIAATWSVEYKERSLNQKTPFKPTSFDMYLNSARKWEGRQPQKTLEPSPPPPTPAPSDDAMLDFLNTAVPERTSHAPR